MSEAVVRVFLRTRPKSVRGFVHAREAGMRVTMCGVATDGWTDAGPSESIECRKCDYRTRPSFEEMQSADRARLATLSDGDVADELRAHLKRGTANSNLMATAADRLAAARDRGRR